MLVLLGVASYMNDFLGLSAFTVGNDWGLPQNYWSIVGGVAVRRAGSVFLHSQGFAVPFLFLMPAATAWIYNRRGKHAWLTRIGYAIMWAGLLVTLTRMTTIVCILQVMIFYLIFRRPEWSLGSVFVVIVIGAVTVLVVPGLLHFIWETLSWQTGSSTSHLKDWTQGALAFFERPWGNGLGTTDAAPLKAFREPLTGDNMYLTYAVQLGVAGIAAFVAVLATIFANAWRVAWANVSDTQRRVAAVVALTTLGIMINGVTSFLFSSNMLAYVFFWLAGAMMTVAQRLRSTDARDLAL
jgi:O-antigen ligase